MTEQALASSSKSCYYDITIIYGGEYMGEQTMRAIMNAAASSAMEGLPLDDEKINIVVKIMNGEMTLQDYLEHIKLRYQET